ncbi:MAG: porin family protein [Desulfovibrionaceae bacterium]|nr:porin family protein [Desulfovibrionaceae bacterium]
MMKKLGVILLAAAFLLPAWQARAADQAGVYVAPKFVLNIQHAKGEWSAIGAGTLGGDSKTAARAGGALAVGYDFGKTMNIPVRAELEYGIYGRASKTLSAVGEEGSASIKTEVGLQTLLLNAYYDIGTYSGFTPYVGGGLGLAFVRVEGTVSAAPAGLEPAGLSFADTRAVFAGQIGLGCSYAITDYAALDLGYRFLLTGNGKAALDLAGIELATVKSKNNYAHQFMLGVRFTF